MSYDMNTDIHDDKYRKRGTGVSWHIDKVIH